MSYGVCNLSVIPARASNSDKAEITTQLLWGEHFEVLEELDRWTYIQTAKDNYTCWIGSKQWLPISLEEYHELNELHPICASTCSQIVNSKTGETSYITKGAVLPFLKDNEFKLAGEIYHFEGQVNSRTISDLIPYALQELNCPYLWGGRTSFGIDCSGLTKLVFRMCELWLPRDAAQQAEVGETVEFIDNAIPGDLAFFDNEQGDIIHVGIIIKKHQIIHASGKVRIDKIDHNGIFREDWHKYTHKLRIIKRI